MAFDPEQLGQAIIEGPMTSGTMCDIQHPGCDCPNGFLTVWRWNAAEQLGHFVREWLVVHGVIPPVKD